MCLKIFIDCVFRYMIKFDGINKAFNNARFNELKNCDENFCFCSGAS